MATQEEQESMDGSPAKVEFGRGGEVYGEIKFQCGPEAEVEVNGTTIEKVIDVLVYRLQGFQKGLFSCRENALAITHLQEARHWLQHRTQARQVQGVEGTNQPHK